MSRNKTIFSIYQRKPKENKPGRSQVAGSGGRGRKDEDSMVCRLAPAKEEFRDEESVGGSHG